MLYLRFKKYALRRCNLFACPLILVLFFWGIISQHYIKADIVGLYAVFLVNIVVSISVIGYIQYLWMLKEILLKRSTTLLFPAIVRFQPELESVLEHFY